MNPKRTMFVALGDLRAVMLTSKLLIEEDGIAAGAVGIEGEAGHLANAHPTR